MKKVSREKLIELLKSKDNNYTYNDLSKLTGYHPKSIIRINSSIKKGNYNINKNKSSLKNKIIDDYLNNDYKSYKKFYEDNKEKYNISYSTLCKMLEDVKTKEEIVFVRKIKNKGKYYFEIIDYKNEKLLFTFDSRKNDRKSFKDIFYIILKKFGAPDKISFINLFYNIPPEMKDLLNKYNVKVVTFKSVYRNIFTRLSNDVKNINYRKVTIVKEDFYDYKIRKTISEGIIQFDNIRYTINSNNKIKKNEKVIIYYNISKDDLFIKYKGKNYKLTPYKKLQSKRGNSKYI